MTYSHLQVGTSKIPAKPPRGQPPCVAPIKYGANILRDPGFERHSANVPVVEGYEFPGEFGVGAPGWPLWYWVSGGGWQDDIPADGGTTGWAVLTNANTLASNHWTISTADPRSGTYHARYVRVKDIPDGGIDPPNLSPVGVVDCVLHPTFQRFGVQSARISPGDFTRFSHYAKVDNLTDALTANTYCKIYNADYSTKLYENGSYVQPMNTSYTHYEHSLFAPADAYWITWYIDLGVGSGTVTTTYDVDDCVLEVQD